MDNDLNNIHLKALNLADVKKKEENKSLFNDFIECLLCDSKFELANDNKKDYLSHLLVNHRLVIADANQIGDFKRYSNYWKEKLKKLSIKDICFEISTNTGKNDKFESENYFLLSDDLPEDKKLREELNIFKLERALKQQEIERNDQNYFRKCLFCNEIIGNNKSNLLNHFSSEHNFNIGLPDNLVYFDEFYEKIRERFDSFQCLYCNKVFYDKQVLKEHMRKKQHKCINPQNNEFDKYYVINYLESGKKWKELRHERDFEEKNEKESKQDESIEDWNDPVQTYFCLFCDDSFELEDDILSHMINSHKYDLKAILKEMNLSFYNQVKIINYIRRQVLSNKCFICKNQLSTKQDLLDHLHENDHIKDHPAMDLWDQPGYYFSTFEDDTLLCLLDDNAYAADEAKIKVIPEQYDIKVKDEIVNDLLSSSIDSKLKLLEK